MQCLSNDCVLNDEDFATATAQINSIMNNRPITKLSDNPDDVRALTPAQIMTGIADASGTPSEFLTPLGYRRSFKMLKESVDAWWKRWRNEYLNTLLQCQKWSKHARNLRKGDLILMVDKNVPRDHWSKSVVTETYPDRWEVVRKCQITTATGATFLRDAHKLILLEGDTEKLVLSP